MNQGDSPLAALLAQSGGLYGPGFHQLNKACATQPGQAASTPCFRESDELRLWSSAIDDRWHG